MYVLGSKEGEKKTHFPVDPKAWLGETQDPLSGTETQDYMTVKTEITEFSRYYISTCILDQIC